MFEFFQSIKAGAVAPWIGICIGLIILLCKYKIKKWMSKLPVTNALQNWDSEADNQRGPRIIGATQIRVVKNSAKGVALMVVMTILLQICFFYIIWWQYNELLIGNDNSWAALVATGTAAGMFSLITWVGLTEYHFDEFEVRRKRFLWRSKVVSWSDVVEVSPLFDGHPTAGSKITFKDKTVFRISSKLYGYRDFLRELSKTNTMALFMFSHSEVEVKKNKQ